MNYQAQNKDVIFSIMNILKKDGGFMNKCIFCNLDNSKLENTILEETENFIVVPALGSLTRGYVLIVAKNHIYNMLELDEKEEYFTLIEKYRCMFKQIYGKNPIVFEHGTIKENLENSSSSVVHAHTHIVNHNYKDEKIILNKHNFEEFNDKINLNKNYLFYISPNGKKYLTYNFKAISQLMRILIAEDLNMKEKYNWKKESFKENIILTINDIKNQ